MAANHYEGVFGPAISGVYGDVFVIDPSGCISVFADNPVPRDCYGGVLISDCPSVSTGGGLYSVVGHTLYCYPTYFTEDDPFGAHQSYGSALGGLAYPGAMATDLSTAHNGSITLTTLWQGKGGFGFESCSITGWTQQSTLTISFPENATLLAPAMDFNSLPTISVASAPCGTSGYTFSIYSGALPAGMHLNASSGAITGTPTENGPYSFTVQAEKASVGSYCYGRADYSGYVWVADGGLLINSTANGPIYINAVRQWEVQRIDAKRRSEARS